MSIVVTGGAGFIGSALALELADDGADVTVLDAFTYAAAPGTLTALAAHPRITLQCCDLRNPFAVCEALATLQPFGIYHLAAESHVDRSIDAPGDFISTNVTGTFHLLQAIAALKSRPRLVHVSTDEVFGDLGPGSKFTLQSPYAPNSPYAASKAASDHLVRAWTRTYGLDAIITNCSNNFGPRQFPEKLVPLMILKALAGEPMPIYGDGLQVRDWLFVGDHVRALRLAMEKGKSGETYLIGARCEKTNLAIVHALIDALNAERPDLKLDSRSIQFVTERPGHDRRYAIDPSSAEQALGFSPGFMFNAAIEATVRWYLEHEAWWRPLVDQGATRRRGA
jgi:dTDP-glucose 4,6-dehydratase